MKKTRILLSGKSNLQYYVDAMEALGAEVNASYLPPIDVNYDGLILCGGDDIEPKRYNEEIDGSAEIDLERDKVEFALLEAYVAAGKPVLGICRGHQLINVYFGGSLYQDMPCADKHRNKTDFYLAHPVSALRDSAVGRLYGREFSVNSSHHQAVKVLGKGLRATATWQGEYVEAIEHTSLPIFGVQWHPERMCFGQKREDTVNGEKILRYFIEICEKGVQNDG